jgi:exosome complex component CSL4
MGKKGDGSGVVMPGDDIAASEEYAAGSGTYERDGRIISSVIGKVELDRGAMVARVSASNPPRQLAIGDVVLAPVSDVRGSMVNLQPIFIEGECWRAAAEQGSLHVSKVSDGRSDDLREQFRLGDVVRAKICQVKPSVQMTTVGPEYGVVKAFCTRCRGPMEARGGELWCEACERAERRKLAKGYSAPRFFANESAGAR